MQFCESMWFYAHETLAAPNMNNILPQAIWHLSNYFCYLLGPVLKRGHWSHVKGSDFRIGWRWSAPATCTCNFSWMRGCFICTNNVKSMRMIKLPQKRIAFVCMNLPSSSHTGYCTTLWFADAHTRSPQNAIWQHSCIADTLFTAAQQL